MPTPHQPQQSTGSAVGTLLAQRQPGAPRGSIFPGHGYSQPRWSGIILDQVEAEPQGEVRGSLSMSDSWDWTPPPAQRGTSANFHSGSAHLGSCPPLPPLTARLKLDKTANFSLKKIGSLKLSFLSENECYKARWELSGVFSWVLLKQWTLAKREVVLVKCVTCNRKFYGKGWWQGAQRFPLEPGFLLVHSLACSTADRYPRSASITPKPYTHARAHTHTHTHTTLTSAHHQVPLFPDGREKKAILYVHSLPCLSICPLTPRPKSIFSVSTPKLKAEHPQGTHSRREEESHTSLSSPETFSPKRQ